jgi:hypothetical protein
VAEWFKALVLKTSVRENVPWVRIPPLPPWVIWVTIVVLDSASLTALQGCEFTLPSYVWILRYVNPFRLIIVILITHDLRFLLRDSPLGYLLTSSIVFL